MVVLLLVGTTLASATEISLEMQYIDNVCALSDSERSMFLNRERSYLLGSLDDNRFRLGINHQINLGRFRNFKMAVFLSGTYVFHAINGELNYLSGSVSLRARSRKNYARITFGFVPYYCSRAYYDPESDSYQWAEYMRLSGSLYLRRRLFRGMYAGVIIYYAFLRYNDYFPEYDSRQYRLGGELTWRGAIDINAKYYFKKSIARGYDQSGEDVLTSDESDISYEQDRFVLSLSRRFNAFERNVELSLTADARFRIYTSQKPYWLDPLHLGRVDRFLYLSGSARFYLTSKWWLELGGRLRLRKATSEHNPNIEALRSYSVKAISMKLGAKF